ncbi:MAG: hypothetical protein PUB21_11135 [Bacteroidales bacterium]|nr:hypothetical protein [Bacteroidales bacterium]
MRKQIFYLSLFLSLFGTTVTAQGQLSGCYFLWTLNKNVDCSISLFNDGRYSVELDEQVSEDWILSMVLSQGFYSIEDKTITLKDDNFGFEIQLERPYTKSVLAERGFVLFKGKTFIYQQDSGEADFWEESRIDSISLKKERETYLQQHKALYPLHFGTYESERNKINNRGERGEGNDYELTLQADHRYTLHYKRIPLLQGSWQRNGNELQLYDESLRHTFYLLIGEEGLISKSLPGEYLGIVLKIRDFLI